MKKFLSATIVLCMTLGYYLCLPLLSVNATSNYTSITNNPPGPYVPKTIIADKVDFHMNLMLKPGDKIISGTTSNNETIYFRFVNSDLTEDISQNMGTGTLSSVYGKTSVDGRPFQSYYSNFTVGSNCCVDLTSHIDGMGRTSTDEEQPNTIVLDIKMRIAPEYNNDGNIIFKYDKPRDLDNDLIENKTSFLQYPSQISEQPTKRWGIVNAAATNSNSYTYYAQNPVMEGYVFAGWYGVENSTIYSDGTSSFTLSFSHRDVNVYPKFYTNAFTIKMNAGVGATIDGLDTKLFEYKFADIPYNLSSHIPVSSNPDAVFEGWYANEDYSGSPVTSLEYFNTIKVVYAKWSVDAVLSQKHSITTLPCANGTITVNKSEAASNENVSITVAPNDGYKLKDIKVLDSLNRDTGAIISNNSFTMPINEPIKIQATFEKINSDGKTNEISSLNSIINFDTPLPDDCTIDIQTVALPKEYEVKEGGKAIAFDIKVLRNSEIYEVNDNKMIIKILLPEDLKGFNYYRVSYLNDQNILTEPQTAEIIGDYLVFETNHLSKYIVEASNVQFNNSNNSENIENNTDFFTTGDNISSNFWICITALSGASLLITIALRKKKCRV